MTLEPGSLTSSESDCVLLISESSSAAAVLSSMPAAASAVGYGADCVATLPWYGTLVLGSRSPAALPLGAQASATLQSAPPSTRALSAQGSRCPAVVLPSFSSRILVLARFSSFRASDLVRAAQLLLCLQSHMPVDHSIRGHSATLTCQAGRGLGFARCAGCDLPRPREGTTGPDAYPEPYPGCAASRTVAASVSGRAACSSSLVTCANGALLESIGATKSFRDILSIRADIKPENGRF